MKALFIILLIPFLAFSQTEVKSFDSAFFEVKEINLTDTRKTDTKVTIFEKHISVRYLDGLFMFQIVTEVPNDRNVTILLVNSRREANVIVVYDENNTAMSFEYKDRIIMFFNKDKLEEYVIPSKIKEFKI